jgi:methionyl aminopeptidase
MIIKKNNLQIEKIRNSCKLAAKCLEFIEPYIKPNVTTNELNELISKFISANGAKSATLGYLGYPKESCISINEVICHGIPSDRILSEGDIVNIDVTVILDGYFGDTSKTFPVGKVSDLAKNLIDATKKCLDIGIKEVKPNVPFNYIGHAITQYIKNTPYSIVDKFVGHGCGIKFHEDPKICHYVDEKFKEFGLKMEPGMIFTIEPMINEGSPDCLILEDNWTAVTIDKKLSAQFEHMVLCTDDGCEILTEI